MQLSLFLKKFANMNFVDLFESPLQTQKAEKKNRSSDALDFDHLH